MQRMDWKQSIRRSNMIAAKTILLIKTPVKPNLIGMRTQRYWYKTDQSYHAHRLVKHKNMMMVTRLYISSLLNLNLDGTRTTN